MALTAFNVTFNQILRELTKDSARELDIVNRSEGVISLRDTYANKEVRINIEISEIPK